MNSGLPAILPELSAPHKAVTGLDDDVAQAEHRGGDVATSNSLTTHSDVRPQWNSDRRELRFHNKIVKRFNRGRATNQVLVLAAFEEQQWVRKIDDPLPPKPGV